MATADLAQRTHRHMLAIVGVLAVATLAGIVTLWPSGGAVPAGGQARDPLASGVIRGVERYQTVPDEIDRAIGGTGEMALVTVEVLDGPDAGQLVEIDTATLAYPSFDVGDEVVLSRSDVPGSGVQYNINDFVRLPALLLLAALFVVAVLAVGRWQGLRSLLGLGLSLLVVIEFMVPAILDTGNPPFAVALVGAMAVMLITLYLAHGVNEMTTSAVLGTTFALTVTIGLGWLFIEQGQVTGFSSEEANFARFAVEGLDLQGLVLAGLVVAALGVLDDVTVSQASTVFALHDTDPSLSWRALAGRAMKVGRDHIASTVNTLFLAYAGASLALLIVFSTGGLPTSEIVNSEILAVEIVKTVVGSLGLISAVPLTTALAATVAVRRPTSAAALRLRARDPRSAAADDGSVDADADGYESWARYLRQNGGADEVVTPASTDEPEPQRPRRARRR